MILDLTSGAVKIWNSLLRLAKTDWLFPFFYHVLNKFWPIFRRGCVVAPLKLFPVLMLDTYSGNGHPTDGALVSMS